MDTAVLCTYPEHATVSIVLCYVHAVLCKWEVITLYVCSIFWVCGFAWKSINCQ
jgi:hypothetical protein